MIRIKLEYYLQKFNRLNLIKDSFLQEKNIMLII